MHLRQLCINKSGSGPVIQSDSNRPLAFGRCDGNQRGRLVRVQNRCSATLANSLREMSPSIAPVPGHQLGTATQQRQRTGLSNFMQIFARVGYIPRNWQSSGGGGCLP